MYKTHQLTTYLQQLLKKQIKQVQKLLKLNKMVYNKEIKIKKWSKQRQRRLKMSINNKSEAVET